MKKNDVVIKVNPTNRQVYFNDNFLGLNAENLQSNLVFEFDGGFVVGTPRIEIEKGENKYIITDVSRVNDTYVMEIKSSLLTTDVIWFQLVITEVGNEEIPIFKSKKFYLTVAESINANTELPDEYATLYDQIEEKIAEVDNINITSERVEDGVEISVTDKTGETTTTKVNDGYTPQKGVDYWTNEDKQEMEQDIVNDVLVDYSLKIDTGHSLDVSIDSSTYVMTLNLKNTAGTTISTQTVDLPLESVVVSGRYDSTNKQIVLELQNGNTINIPLGDLVSGLQEEITTENKLASDLVDDTNQTNKFVTTQEKTTWNNKSDFSGNYNDLTNKPDLSVYIDETELADSQAEQDEKIELNSMVYNTLPKATATGTDITIDNTANTPMEIELSPSELEQEDSPTPESPQDIHVVSGDNEVKVTGKNLFNKNDAVYVENYIKNDNGIETDTQGFGYTSTYVGVKPNTMYTLSGELTNNSGTVRVYYYDKNKNWISRSDGFGVNVIICTFTTPNDCYYIQYQYIRVAYNADTIQIEKGSATEYEPYQEQKYPINLGNLEYCKTGDAEDEFVYNTTDTTLELNKWYLKKNVGKVVLDGSEDESWGYSAQTNSVFVMYNFSNDYARSNNIPYSNYYIGKENVANASTASSYGGNNSVMFTNNSSSNFFYIVDNNYTNKNDYIAWLSTHNLKVYYQLATPQYILLNDTLQTQLNNLQKAISYSGQTNITQTNNDLPFVINASANKNVPSKTSELVNDSGYVKDTDYASSSKGGVIKATENYGVSMQSAGQMYATNSSYATYQNASQGYFIGKGTLENVITGKGLVKDTDYARANKAGVIKTSITYATSVNTSGFLIAGSSSNYGTLDNNAFISKGTLENAVISKGLLTQSDVKNNVVSTDTNKPLSANMGKELNDRIQNLASIGKYLAMWDCVDGVPTTDPVTMPYAYTTGDYYVISNVGATNYMPNGSSYDGDISETEYTGTETLNVGDFFYYDGTVWSLLKNTGKTVYFANIAGNPTDNSNLASALNAKVGFTDYASSGTGGVVKTSSDYGTDITGAGRLCGTTKIYSDYSSGNNALLVSKGTLENVLSARFITLSQADYDALVSGGTVDSNTYYFIEEE